MKHLKRLFVVVFAALALASCDNTTLNLSRAEKGSYVYYYDKKWNDGFLENILWDGDFSNTTFTIPEEVNGFAMKGMGGSTSEINDYGFLSFNNHYFKIENRNYKPVVTQYSLYQEIPTETNYCIKFTIMIPKSIKFIQINPDSFIHADVDIDGDIVNTLCNIVYYFECEDGNENYYSKDGYLFEKNTDNILYAVSVKDYPTEYYVFLNK